MPLAMTPSSLVKMRKMYGPKIITCFGVCVGRILWLLFVVPQYHTIEMLVWGYPISWALTSILFIVYYLQGGWLRRSIRKAGFEPEVREKKRRSEKTAN